MIGTGLRVGEVTGLRWCDIDLEEGIIDVNHTLVYYDHRTEGSKRGCYFNVNTTKTPAGRRKVPMLGFVKEAFLMEKKDRNYLTFIVKRLLTDTPILSSSTVSDSRNIRQPSTKQFAVLFVTVTMSSC